MSVLTPKCGNASQEVCTLVSCWLRELNFGVNVEPELRTLVMPGAHQALPLSLSLSLLGRALAERCVYL